MLTVPKVLTLSRPRFWLYIAGPFLVGYTLTIMQVSDFMRGEFVIGLLWFLVPANIFLYGINDLFDEDTDQFNLKKQQQERSQAARYKVATQWLLLLCVLLAGILVMIWPIAAGIAVIVFLLLSYGYSAPPTRLKARAGWDSYSNILYISPGIAGYFLGLSLQGQSFQLDARFIAGCIAAGSWALAMHAFSAIPDIEPDKKAGLATIAVSLGRTFTLLFTSFHWLIATLLTALYLSPIGWMGLLYVVIPLWLISQPVGSESKVYWWFPYINAVVGAVLFWSVVALRLW